MNAENDDADGQGGLGRGAGGSGQGRGNRSYGRGCEYRGIPNLDINTETLCVL